MDTNFYKDKKMVYDELGVVLEDFNYKEKGKIYIGVLLPESSGSNPVQVTSPKQSVSNILNETGKNGIVGYTISNYMELHVPEYIGFFIKNKDDNIIKGTKFIITFLGGEINRPRVIGVDYDD